MKEIFSYDVMPYPSKFFLQMHPDRLAAHAAFFGVSAPAVETCRVLELGCGNGSNLISHAFHLPDAKFVGVDLAQNHIDDANRGAAELGLANTDFRQMDVAEMTVGEFGRFDYIIAHGLFSWVPEFVRDRVLEVCREMLAENGVGYISYNALPGAHYRQMVQEMLRFHTRKIAEPLEKVGKAISFLSFLSENTTDRDIYRPILSSELKRHFEHDAADIFHDDLSDLNRAYYFHEFAEMLQKHDLQYLAEAELHAMGTGSLPPDARGFVESIDDPIEREQYLDFFRGRIFRQTLFCRAGIKLERDPQPSRIREFKVASSIRAASPNPELASAKIEKFVGSKGLGIEIDHPLTKAALVELGRIWGRAIDFTELLECARDEIVRRGFEADDWDEQFAITESIFMQLCQSTALIELHLFQPAASQEVPDRPVTNSLARWQLPQANNVLTMLNLDVKVEDAVSRRLLELLDGKRSKAELKTDLRTFVEASDDLEDKAELLKNLPEWIDESLFQLAKLGMFE
ncbi:MAG: class I SAM-dependent methyltransferase [Acidobacteria bacterium]|nr:class I SAM-dependent methyltransferase [Acidobacteriota bacterium]